MRSLYGAIANTNKKEIMVSVDTVYQKVLAITNKEQRGYITPQEFNLFADHAQMEIFDQYFYDVEQFERNPSSDIDGLIEQKTQIFKIAPILFEHGNPLPLNTYQIDDAWIRFDSGERGVIERIERSEVMGMMTSSLLRTSLAPCYYVYNNIVYFTTAFSSLNAGTGGFYLNLIRKPKTPNWTYVIVGESAMFDNSLPGFQDFELHHSEETLLVIKILQLAGVNTKDPALVQIASQQEMKKTQQEKQ